MFMRNTWYAAAWNHEVKETPIARTLLNEPVVLYRDTNGKPVALEDRCCHRSLPLANGRVKGDYLQCGYHGMTFNAAGDCVEVPGQTTVPPGARVKSYPVIERHQWIWIWMGDPDLADETLIPDWWWMDHPDWRTIKGDPTFYLQCDYKLVTDNLLDLSHLSFVHETTIGTDAVVKFPITTSRGEDRVFMTRWILDSPPPDMYVGFLRHNVPGYHGNVDRWQIVETSLPANSDVFVGVAVAGTGAPDGDYSQGIEFHNLNTVTPETETTCHYFYAHARRFAQDDKEVDELYRVGFRTVFMEDVTVFDAQQANHDRFPVRHEVDINTDGPGMNIRRMIDQRIAAEIESGANP